MSRTSILGSPVVYAWIVVLSAGLYYGAFIYKTSFVVDGVRHFCLLDDAMISMRYARNLALGYGLVWNPGGEPIEGYTNPLWVLYMAALHVPPISPSKISLLVQLTSAMFLLVTLGLVWKIAGHLASGAWAVSLGAVALSAFYLPLVNWSLQGMEVALLACLTTWSVWCALCGLSARQFVVAPYLILGVSVFVRPDMSVSFLALTGFAVAADPSHRTRHLFAGAGILAVALLAQTGFRLWYFGDALPNTYYLKLTGYPVLLRLSRGLFVFLKFALQMGMVLFLLPFLAVLIRRDTAGRLLASVFVGQALYSIYVGGDAWEVRGGSNRYVSVAMPLFFILLSRALWDLSDLLRQHLPLRRFAVSAYVGLVVSSLISLNSIRGADALWEWALRVPNRDVLKNAQQVTAAYLLRAVTAPTATVAVTRAGVLPYFSDRFSIDLLGKNDRHVAHLAMKRSRGGIRSLTFFLPGHLKWDLDYSIGRLRPDVVAGPEDLEREGGRLLKNYTKYTIASVDLFMRNDSAEIRWNELQSRVPATANRE
jgi:hypothetical protein